MSHPPTLIADIRRKVESDYPPADYDFAVERALPGTRMFPDILVTSKRGDLVCAVEIGYTRPEKLTHYREIGIADVRWYDKQGNLHSDWQDVNTRVNVQVAGAEPDEVAMYWPLPMVVECGNCRCESACGSNECDDTLCSESSYATLALLLTDDIRYWLVVYCDQCDASWAEDGANCRLVEDLRWLRPDAFGREYGARRLMTWPEALAEVPQNFEHLLSPLDGHYVDDSSAGMDEIRRAVRRRMTRVQSIRFANPSDE